MKQLILFIYSLLIASQLHAGDILSLPKACIDNEPCAVTWSFDVQRPYVLNSITKAGWPTQKDIDLVNKGEVGEIKFVLNKFDIQKYDSILKKLVVYWTRTPNNLYGFSFWCGSLYECTEKVDQDCRDQFICNATGWKGDCGGCDEGSYMGNYNDLQKSGNCYCMCNGRLQMHECWYMKYP